MNLDQFDQIKPGRYIYSNTPAGLKPKQRGFSLQKCQFIGWYTFNRAVVKLANGDYWCISSVQILDLADFDDPDFRPRFPEVDKELTKK